MSLVDQFYLLFDRFVQKENFVLLLFIILEYDKPFLKAIQKLLVARAKNLRLNEQVASRCDYYVHGDKGDNEPHVVVNQHLKRLLSCLIIEYDSDYGQDYLTQRGHCQTEP